MNEPNLADLLEKLQSGLDESRAARARLEAMLTGQIESLWADQAALRDELHSTNAALANRIEGIVRL